MGYNRYQPSVCGNLSRAETPGFNYRDRLFPISAETETLPNTPARAREREKLKRGDGDVTTRIRRVAGDVTTRLDPSSGVRADEQSAPVGAVACSDLEDRL